MSIFFFVYLYEVCVNTTCLYVESLHSIILYITWNSNYTSNHLYYFTICLHVITSVVSEDLLEDLSDYYREEVSKQPFTTITSHKIVKHKRSSLIDTNRKKSKSTDYIDKSSHDITTNNSNTKIHQLLCTGVHGSLIPTRSKIFIGLHGKDSRQGHIITFTTDDKIFLQYEVSTHYTNILSGVGCHHLFFNCFRIIECINYRKWETTYTIHSNGWIASNMIEIIQSTIVNFDTWILSRVCNTLV